MSDYENHKGKAERVEKNLDELFDELILNFTIPDYYQKPPYSKEDKKEIIQDNFDDYVFTSKGIFHIIEDKQFDEDDIMEIDDNLNFHLKFYNGGCNFGEAFAQAVEENQNIKSIDNKNKYYYEVEICIGNFEINITENLIFDNKEDATKAIEVLDKANNIVYTDIIEILKN